MIDSFSTEAGIALGQARMHKVAKSKASSIAIGVSLAIAALIPVVQFFFLFGLVSNMPKWDQWSLIPVWDAYFSGRPVLPLLLSPYNGHLNLIPRWIFFGLGLLTDWNVRAEVLASYVVAIATLGVLLLMLRDSGQKLLILAAPVSAYVFCVAQFENFLNGYALGQNLSQLAATATVYWLSRPSLPRRRFWLAVAAALVATFSWGAGVTVWPLGLIALVTHWRKQKTGMAVWIGLSFAVLVLVRLGAKAVVLDWPAVPTFFFAVLGRLLSLERVPELGTALPLGCALAAVFLFLCVAALRRPHDLPVLRPWILLGLLATGSALLIALGRARAGVRQAFASHYYTAVYPLTVAVLALITLLILRWIERAPQLRGIGIGALASLILLVILQTGALSGKWIPVLRHWSDVTSVTDYKLLLGAATDEEIRQSHHPEPALVRWGTEVLRQHRLAWFADSAEFGDPVGEVETLAEERAGPGPFTARVGQPWVIEGWAAGSRRKGGPISAVELYINGQFVKSADLGIPREDLVSTFRSSGFRFAGWRIDVPGSELAVANTYYFDLLIRGVGGSRRPLLNGLLVAAAPAGASPGQR